MIQLSEFEKNIDLGSTIVVGVSGGLDSMVLLSLLLSSEKVKKIIVAHVDHGIRNDSAIDAGFVRDYCSKHDVDYKLATITPPRHADGTFSENLEQWGRKERYSFFETVRQENNADFIATAHNADDQIELYLMRLFTNKPFAAMPVYEVRRKLLRPLLSFRRRNIQNYALAANIQWVEDATNKDNSYLRNRTRNVLIPCIAQLFGESSIDELQQKIADTEEENEFFYRFVHQTITALAGVPFGSKEWKLDLTAVLESESSAIQWRICDQIFFDTFKRRLGKEGARRMVGFLLSNAPSLQLPHGVTIKRAGGGIEFTDTVG